MYRADVDDRAQRRSETIVSFVSIDSMGVVIAAADAKCEESDSGLLNNNKMAKKKKIREMFILAPR